MSGTCDVSAGVDNGCQATSVGVRVSKAVENDTYRNVTQEKTIDFARLSG